MTTPAKIADVLLVLPVLEPSGAERIVAELALRLPALGFPTSVLCLEDDNAAVGIELKNAGVRVDGLHLSRRRTLACASGIHKRILEFSADEPLVVCAQLFHANIAARLAYGKLSAERKQRVRVATTVQVAERRFRPWQFALDRFTAHLASVEICVSDSVANFHCAKTGLPRAFFNVIRNGIDLSRFSNSVSQVVRPLDHSRVVSVGRLNKQKDYPTLLRAWRIVAAKFPGAKLEIAGTGAEALNLEALCLSLDLDSVRFVGFQENVPAFLSGADLYVQSSAWEGLPLSVMEAMAAGLPVIASAVDSLPEIIENGLSGILFERGNHAQLADLIVKELSDPQHAKALGAAAREVALSRFSADRMAAEYAATFKEILAKGSAPID